MGVLPFLLMFFSPNPKAQKQTAAAAMQQKQEAMQIQISPSICKPQFT